MEKLKFGIDVDGVLRNLLGEIVKIYNSKFNSNISYEDFTHYDVNEQLPEIKPSAAEYFFSGEIAKHIMLYSKPIKGSLDAFKILSDIGTVYIITSQHGYDNMKNTLEWFHLNGFDTDNICFLTEKNMISGLDYMIDDNPDKFTNCDCKNAILIDAPYNHYDMTDVISTCKCESFERYDDLESFVNTLIKK